MINCLNYNITMIFIDLFILTKKLIHLTHASL